MLWKARCPDHLFLKFGWSLLKFTPGSSLALTDKVSLVSVRCVCNVCVKELGHKKTFASRYLIQYEEEGE